jgi:hypothetical protein
VEEELIQPLVTEAKDAIGAERQSAFLEDMPRWVTFSAVSRYK